MKILVTGATGFVGSHLTDLLTSEGHEVYSLVRNPKKAAEFQTQGHIVVGNLDATNTLEWIDVLPENLDAVIHTAGVVHSVNPDDFFIHNTKTTNNLINQLHKKYAHLHFTYISSLAAAGPSTGEEKCEEHDKRPVSSYGRSKLESEYHLKELSGWTYTIIMPPMVIGPRDTAVLDIFKMVKSRFVIGPGINFKNKKYSFINVFDLVDAIKYLTIEKGSGSYFISHPRSITFVELINAINKNMGMKRLFFIPIPHPLLRIVGRILTIFPVASRLTSDKVHELVQENWICSPKRYLETTNQVIKFDLENTVKMTQEDYEARKWL
ncbi:NAD-dependent epimerase/dehydratase family protein [Bacteriovorax sp. Seq25_V]|uniref:NAD-dependent epimerase/dehydratase family protein n=1 Tax=Bacteriovorax sp. Seq25_V TaxID=1201288 RepID=UPI000389EEF0|nr:NAD(P)-dependent oxidoreductase [Bacteriovorax sp. Seq25_V]EQC46261.1 NADH(P)-binding protein, PF13460 family [Bacteriovorax sp. Seq25_V]